MLMTLQREDVDTKRAIGRLYVDYEFQCFTLEDTPRVVKIPGLTAIPMGLYKVEYTYSPKFKQVMPELRDVPGFSGIRIHTGNDAEDTEGCILVGRRRGPDVIYESRLAYQALLPRIIEACRHDGCYIDIRDVGHELQPGAKLPSNET